MTNQETVDLFLKSYRMHADQIDMDHSVNLFLSDMRQGLCNEESSLLMLPTYITAKQSIRLNKKVIVIDAGGTNFRTALVSFNDDQRPIIESFKKCAMPGFNAEVSRSDFFNIIAQQITDIADQSDIIGFCFSYPTEILSNGDGRVITFSKEIKAQEVVGQLLGEGIRKALKNLGASYSHTITVVNDTVTTLLTGLLHHQRSYDGYIGFVLGTGINSAYEELIRLMKDVGFHKADELQVVNIESGLFDKIEQGEFDLIADELRESKGHSIYEKMIAGAYLGDLMSKSMIGLISDCSLFSSKTVVKLKNIADDIVTEDISIFLANPTNRAHKLALALNEASQNEVELLYILFDYLVTRTAKLAAISICATILKSDHGRSPLLPLCINIDGTTYHQMRCLAQRIESFINQYLIDDNLRYYEIIHMQDASLLGAAIAVL